MEEIWKDVPGFEGIYQASNLGRIKSVGRVVKQRNRDGSLKDCVITEKILSQMVTPGGYLRIGACYNGMKRKFYAHVLIAMAWIPNPDKKPCVNHINGIKTDNRLENLEWATNRENSLHGQRGRNNTGVVGLYFSEKRQKYTGAILYNGKRYSLTYYKTIEEAKAAYLAKMEEFGLLHTRYALLDG